MGLESSSMPLFPRWNQVLRQLRERTSPRLSQAEAGKALGVTGKTISAYERGEIEPQVSTFSSLLELYGVRTLSQLQREIDIVVDYGDSATSAPIEGLARELAPTSKADMYRQLAEHLDSIARLEAAIAAATKSEG